MIKSKAYDTAKVALMLLVVFAHSSRMYDGGVYTPVWDSFSLRWLTAMIYAFHMPGFFMLSGCLWGYQARQGKYRKAGEFLKKKSITLLLPYLAVGVCIVAPTMVGLGLTEESFFSYVWNGILLGKNNRHLWYLTALFWMFLMTVPLRHCLTAKIGWGCLSVAALCLALGVVAPLPGIMQLGDAAKYAVFFFIGICVDRYWEVLFGSRKKCLLGAAICLCIYGLRAFRNNEVLFYLCALAGSLAMFAILSLLPESLTQNKLFCLLRENSFGIYLLHPMLIYLFFSCTWYRDIHPWVLCGSVSGAALAASMLLSIGLRKAGLGCVLGETGNKKSVAH